MLVTISIPIFTSQLEKSREAVDAANIRAAYAEIMAAALTGDLPASMDGYDVPMKQKTKGFATTFDWPDNLNITPADAEGTAKFTYNATTEKITVTFS